MIRAATFRTLLSRESAMPVPGVHDAFTALLAERAGHEAVYLGGNAMALGLGKGQPYITLSETSALVARVAGAVAVPVVVDAGAGFGDLTHLHLAIRELENAGAAAIHLDDQPYPKSADYHRGRGALINVDGFAARIRQACRARRNPETLIIARTDALRVTGSLEPVLERALACAAAGCDGLIVLDLTPDQANAVRVQVPDLPLIWIGGVHSPVPSRSDLGAAAFAAALYPFNGIAEIATRLGDLWSGLAGDGHIHQDSARLARARQETTALVDLQGLWDIIDAAGAARQD